MAARVRSGVILVIALFALVSLLSYSRTDVEDYQPGAAVHNWCGIWGAQLASLLRRALGIAVFVPVLVGTVWGVLGVGGKPMPRAWSILAGTLVLTLVVCVAMPLVVSLTHNSPDDVMQGGGIGYKLSQVCLRHLGPVGSILLVAISFVIGCVLAGGSGLVPIVETLGAWARRGYSAVVRWLVQSWANMRGGIANWWAAHREAATNPPDWDAEEALEPPAESPRYRRYTEPELAPEPEPAKAVEAPAPEEKPDRPKKEVREEPVVREAPPEPKPKPASPAEEPKRKKRPPKKPKQLSLIEREDGEDEYDPPPVELLDEAPIVRLGSEEEDVRTRARKLETTLSEFNIGGKVVAIEKGPVITQYEIELAPGIKVNKIVSLTDDIARAMKAVSVRVVAPIPGKSTVGVELPNAFRDTVKMRDLFHTLSTDNKKHSLPLLLGRDAAGAPLVADLTGMPHLLIAGATGSGKSVCINSIIMSLCMLHRPDKVKLLLVDPKMVELSVYKDIPHLISPVVTDMKKAAAVLEWAVAKMDDRYSMMANVGVRNINSYNRLGEEGIRQRLDPDGEGMDLSEVPKHLPYIVIIVDELADLMMVASKEVEASIIRLSQKSRAVGIHLIMATQRPSVDVITGLIKSNLPSRIAFQVASKVDSRTILDRNGAEALLGRGDMLFLPPGSSKLIRAQGAFVDEHEVREICEWLREQGSPEYSRELVQLKSASAEDPSVQDPLFGEAVRIIVESQRGSLSLLQRRLEVGYSRAARLIDMMEAAGIVGEYKGSQAREVNMTMEEWEETYGAPDPEDQDA